MTGHGRSRRCYRDKAARPECPTCGTRVPCEDCRRTNREQREADRRRRGVPERVSRAGMTDEELADRVRALDRARYRANVAAISARRAERRAQAQEESE